MPSNKNKSTDVFLSTEWRFLHPKQHKTSHFRDVLPKPISRLSTEETKPDTIKANNWESYGLMCILLCTITVHNKEQQQQSFYRPLSGTTRVSRYQKKHSPTNHPDHHPLFISFFHLLRSMASSLFKLRAWQSYCTTNLHIICGLESSTSY